jgi:phospholipid transport system transporter-binding protein
MRCDGRTLHLEGAVTMDTVPALAAQAPATCAGGIDRVDLAGVTEFDSAGIALALELRRVHGAGLRFVNLPAAARNLARLYSITGPLGLVETL